VSIAALRHGGSRALTETLYEMDSCLSHRILLSRPEHLGDGGGQLLPFALFGFELFAPAAREFIVFRAAIVLGCAPARLDPGAAFETMQRWIERALLHLEDFARNLMDALGDGPAVHGFKSESPEDQEIERALRKIDALFVRMCC